MMVFFALMFYIRPNLFDSEVPAEAPPPDARDEACSIAPSSKNVSTALPVARTAPPALAARDLCQPSLSTQEAQASLMGPSGEDAFAALPVADPFASDSTTSPYTGGDLDDVTSDDDFAEVASQPAEGQR